ncbi:mcm10, partial [Symbiodinium pilosum]
VEGTAQSASERELRKARLQDLCAQRTLRLREAQAKEEAKQAVEEAERISTTERWSGLRIVDRLVRQEKWDASMKGKEIVQLRHLAKLLSRDKDKVVIVVLAAAPRKLITNAKGEQVMEWTVTDLDKEAASEAGLIFLGRAQQHWLEDTQAKPGHILAVLNPQLSCRTGAIMVTFETQVILLGTCPAFRTCSALNASGGCCLKPCNAEGSGFCGQHSKALQGVRQATPCRKRKR